MARWRTSAWPIRLCRLGQVALAVEQYPEADRWLLESLALSRRIRNDLMMGRSLWALGLAACRQGALAQAEARLRESLAPVARSENRMLRAELLEAFAELWAEQRREVEAVGLYAAADSLRKALGAPAPPCARPRQTRALAALQTALGPERFTAAWEGARCLAVDALLALADGGEAPPR